jgi:hypothetical protein
MERPIISMNARTENFMWSGTSLYETRKELTFRGACLWRLCNWQHSPFPMSHSLLMLQSSPVTSRDMVVYVIFSYAECMSSKSCYDGVCSYCFLGVWLKL